jgi:hypothetical protein
MAQEVYLKAKEAGQFSAAVAALRELGIFTGYRLIRCPPG